MGRRNATSRWITLLGLTAVLSMPAGAEVTAAPVPFGPGELLTYKVRLGIFDVGESSM